MDDYIFMKKNAEAEKLAAELGFTKLNFLDSNFVILKGKTQKELLKEIESARNEKNKKAFFSSSNFMNNKKLKTVFRADSEEMLRFAMEKNGVDIIYGMESINPKDSLHFVRGGLDQILCNIAGEKEKILAFSFAEILNSSDRAKLLARIMFNVKLCKKYKVQMMLSSFASSREEMRSAKDLQALGRVLGL
ncbi:MAG: RNase P subunit p30 family protein [Nanoarchaeota archaeon]